MSDKRNYDFSEIKVAEDTVYLRDNGTHETERMRNHPEFIAYKVGASRPGLRIVFKDVDGQWYEIVKDADERHIVVEHVGIPN